MLKGLLSLVSVGPGDQNQITAAAQTALKNCDVVVGYGLYLNWIGDWIAEKEIIVKDLTFEIERAKAAIEQARAGKKVCLVSSGDIGVYAMATLAFEQMSEADTFDVEVLPGVTAALASASILGAPLSHDFATLSLSNLLCPWQWIEDRASALAQCDMVVALYNVQSKTRRDGVYKIIQLFLEHKDPQTLCGIVSNAYRPNQSNKIVTLEELQKCQFDMFTTIVIGNRHSQRKRDWLYTPRGYGGWSAGSENRNEKSSVSEIPECAVFVFAGTKDGNDIAAAISQQGFKTVISTATKYGQETAHLAHPESFQISGALGKIKRADLLKASNAVAIVDATHPHAEKISKQLIEISREEKIPYIRYERTAANLSNYLNLNLNLVRNFSEAGRLAVTMGQKILLTTGVKDLAEILAGACIKDFRDGEQKWFLRTIPDQNSIAQAVALGFPRTNIISMQGPFNTSFNRALMEQWQIDLLITKDSGQNSGLEAKLEAASNLEIPVALIAKPEMTYPKITSKIDEIILYLKQIGVKNA